MKAYCNDKDKTALTVYWYTFCLTDIDWITILIRIRQNLSTKNSSLLQYISPILRPGIHVSGSNNSGNCAHQIGMNHRMDLLRIAVRGMSTPRSNKTHQIHGRIEIKLLLNWFYYCSWQCLPHGFPALWRYSSFIKLHLNRGEDSWIFIEFFFIIWPRGYSRSILLLNRSPWFFFFPPLASFCRYSKI